MLQCPGRRRRGFGDIAAIDDDGEVPHVDDAFGIDLGAGRGNVDDYGVAGLEDHGGKAVGAEDGGEGGAADADDGGRCFDGIGGLGQLAGLEPEHAVEGRQEELTDRRVGVEDELVQGDAGVGADGKFGTVLKYNAGGAFGLGLDDLVPVDRIAAEQVAELCLDLAGDLADDLDGVADGVAVIRCGALGDGSR